MKQPIIGIAGNQLIHATEVFNGNFVTYTPQGFVDGVLEAGGLPFILPISHPDTAKEYIKNIDKLLLAGGQDVSPRLYNEEPHPKLQETNYSRDIFEAALIKEAIKQKKPILSVCRGTQLLNVVLGGSLYQDLSQYEQWSVKHEQQPTAPQFSTHRINVAPNSRISQLVPDNSYVNSYHHQAIKDVSPKLIATAWSTDGLVEAVEADDGSAILGVQWHPELTHHVDEKEQRIFDYFVNEMSVVG
ncbi:gamma-glutamyl-gamma-aminobutyrate hydrolase family protein [Candidatus Enterococcus huntleyi]|uniref:gamma-glutamyl-gamma-aminobutyrate hydrolase family protein n=1 Tax=Candidatus Enterococcus huntleyi TaxID=1857217 RepID=UPI001F438705|nr:gamma-glutamyl-gamma-aminobutyrate hydrolase family protein [Enterococcus sp. JM4C]